MVDTDSWVSNAVNSLTTIIREYKLDGIDIDYESFKSDTNTFTKCIGQLIRTLKQTGVIQFASIAPYNDPTVQEKYQALWREHGDFIDYVNFQFYAYPQILNVEQYVQYYDSQMANYPGANVLASFSTGNEVNRIDICLNACESLNMQGKLNGIFNWSADNSLLHNRLNYEEQAQEILAGPN
ncbi:hypothetical protein LUZ63_015902 [Rhynchospora breviuscula]|uniref:GH18 domain-containing protein n=1 Tax=Rhynchospora breviuscula TaxID=2022672 RepID=A0A9Q0CDG8_9POAL|nr:hypothetical protein LUZ63_015902 [Rhynchospora breviuscula]